MIDVTLKVRYDEYDSLDKLLSEQLGVEVSERNGLELIRRGVDASDRENIFFRTTVSLNLTEREERRLCRKYSFVRESDDREYRLPENRMRKGDRPVVVGSGPAGLFAALILAEAGAAPILIERGGDVDERLSAVTRFNCGGGLSRECNIQFGEGGAGAFSDGKLKAGRLDPVKCKILGEFVSAGAPRDILVRTDAHIGTDILPQVVKGIRKKIIACGGDVRFHTRMTGISVSGGRLSAVITDNGEIKTENAVIATGHSARDVFGILYDAGARLEPKGFGIGVRAEHPQEYIDRLVYGELAGDPRLGPASYHLVEHLPGGRSAYSFCMCPGGSVVAAASEDGGVVTNGMSPYRRDGRNANAALLVSVTPQDFGNSLFGGTELQRRLEAAAFKVGGENYTAPGQKMGDFLAGISSRSFGQVEPTYPLGCRPTALEEFLPDFITATLREAIPRFDAWMPGYYLHDAWLTGVESRSTSPVRVLRHENMQAVGISGLYPCGEGAGYAGGILSAAADGVRCAEAILSGDLI